MTALEALLASKGRPFRNGRHRSALQRSADKLSAFLGPSPRTSDRRPSWPSSSGSSATTGPTSSWEASRPATSALSSSRTGPRQHLQEAAEPDPNPEWSARFEHGFSQLTDWFFQSRRLQENPRLHEDLRLRARLVHRPADQSGGRRPGRDEAHPASVGVSQCSSNVTR